MQDLIPGHSKQGQRAGCRQQIRGIELTQQTGTNLFRAPWAIYADGHSFDIHGTYCRSELCGFAEAKTEHLHATVQLAKPFSAMVIIVIDNGE